MVKEIYKLCVAEILNLYKLQIIPPIMLQKGKKIRGEPLVSVIVAAYNEEEHIAKLIKSVFNQSYKNWEIVIVDDNSADKTKEILKKFVGESRKIKFFKQKLGVRGPGNAWNLAIKHSMGKILFIVGADMVLGKNYLRDMAKPILEGRTIGTMHKEEKIINKNKIWARAFGVERGHIDKNNESTIFSAILREYYFKSGGFKSELGYSDDQSLYKNLKIKSIGVNAEIYHHNPEKFMEIWNHHKWVGASYKSPILITLSLPIFPAWVIYKTFRQLKDDFFLPFVFFLPVYNTIRYFGYFRGALNRIIFRKIYE